MRFQSLSLRQCPHYAKGILFLWLGPLSTLVPQENGAFRKRYSNQSKLTNADFSFLCGWRTFWKESFLQMLRSRYVISPTEFFSNTVPKWPNLMPVGAKGHYKRIWLKFLLVSRIWKMVFKYISIARLLLLTVLTGAKSKACGRCQISILW